MNCVTKCRFAKHIVLKWPAYLYTGSGRKWSTFCSHFQMHFREIRLSDVDANGSIWQYIDHDDVIKWKHFPRYWSFVRGIHRSPVNSPHKGQWRDAFFDLRPNKRLSKQSWGWWFETSSRWLWCHCNVIVSVMAGHRKDKTQLIKICVTMPQWISPPEWTHFGSSSSSCSSSISSSGSGDNSSKNNGFYTNRIQ